MINKNIGSLKQFCRDDLSKIENYDEAIKDTENLWECHHRLELTLDGEFAHTKDELIRLGMYYDRPAFELVFLPISVHRKMHYATSYMREMRSKCTKGNTNKKGSKLSEESRKKISESKKGKKRRHNTFK